jgi:nitrogen fixation/metabolism regulation signal transduction histidine kinase
LAAEALVRPLRHLKYAAERISRGDLGVELSIRSRDEIGELATSFERMIAAIKFFREQSHSQPDSDDMAPPDPPSERA